MGGLAIQHWTHGAELVLAAGMLPGCLKLWGAGQGSALGRRDRAIFSCSVPPAKSRSSAVTLQLHVAAGAMGDGEKPGQMCLLGAEITPDPFPVTSFSPNHPPIFTTLGATQDKLVEMGP